MKHAWLLLALAGCVNSERALEDFCAARPDACDAGTALVCPASDEFVGPGVSPCFTQYDAVVPATSRPAIVNGSLVLEQQLGSWTWSNGSLGGFVSQEVTGTFVVETFARVAPLEGVVDFSGNYVAAALLAADPDRLTNSRLISVGRVPAEDGGFALGPLVEINGPTGSNFDHRGGEGFASAALRLCRFGRDGGTLDWAALYRPPDGGTWVSFTPPANPLVLPDRVAVGLATYQVGASDVHRMTFDYFRIRQSGLTTLIDCAQALDGGP